MWEGWPCFPYLKALLQSLIMYGKSSSPHPKKVGALNKPFEDFHYIMMMACPTPP
jgi:hypothetical protein